MRKIGIDKHGPGASRPRSMRFLSTTTVVLLIAAFVLATTVSAPSARAASGLRKIASFPRPTGVGAIYANGNILLNPSSRRGYQISKSPATTVYEFDLDSLAILRKKEIPPISLAAAERKMDWFWIMDAPNNRMIFLVDDYAKTLEFPTLQTQKLAILDLGTLEVSEPKTLWPMGDSVAYSFSYDPPSQHIFMITGNQADAFGGALRVEERTLDGTLVGTEHPLSKCVGATDQQYSATTVRSLIERNFVYLNCYGSNRIQSQIVRIDLGDNSRLDSTDSEELFPALPGPLSTMFDPGSDRLFFLTANKGAGRGAWVFDGLRDSFLGVIATGESEGTDYSMGLDEATGRIYMQTRGGLVVADGRRTPLPGRLIFKDFKQTGFGKIQIDPVNRHVFLADVEGLSLPTTYSVLKDELPVSRDPDPGNPDSLTTDIDEKSGATDVNLAASARSFAVRSLTTGGAQRAAWNLSLGSLLSPEETDSLVGHFGVPPNLMTEAVPLDQGNRDLYLSRVRRVTLSSRNAEASAILADSDEPTTRDLSLAGQNWPYSSMDCLDPGDAPSSKADENSQTSVSCNSGTSAVWAASGGGKLLANTSTFSVSATASTGAVYRDPGRGLVSTSESILKGITIAGVIRIGELRTVAMTWAKGRKGSARGFFDRRLGDVSVDTNNDGVFDFYCGSGASASDRTCDLRTASSAIAKALEGKASVSFPDPDPSYSKGSPGGYQAVIQKNSFQSYSERSLNDDDTPEVVGMQIVFFADAKAGRSRQVLQLAGVQAEAHYGIYQLPGTSSANSDPEGFSDQTIGTSFKLQPSVQGDQIAAAAPVLGVSKAAFDRIVERIAAGWGFLIASASDALKLAALWMLFLLPLYLIGRRRFIAV